MKRMLNRRFTEVDVRRMLRVVTRLRSARCEVIVELDQDAEMLVIITAYPAERGSS